MINADLSYAVCSSAPKRIHRYDGVPAVEPSSRDAKPPSGWAPHPAPDPRLLRCHLRHILHTYTLFSGRPRERLAAPMPDPPAPRPPAKRGRAAGFNTPNRFEPLHLEPDPAEPGEEGFEERVPTRYLIDASRSILAENDSPDVGFRFSLNPYRGCEHGCVYCYARPTHEYLGFSAGLDFETKILVKEQAPELLEAALRKRSWQPQVVALSGNTDCYQPVERRLQLTRRCLEVFLRFRNPVSLITKNHLVTRDLDILERMAALDLVHVTLSITSLDRRLTAAMEPRTSRPERRLQALEELSRAGVPAGVNVAPLIPGLNDSEAPAILEAAAARGARWANYILVRLPGAVRPLFLDWLQRHYPDRAEQGRAPARGGAGGTALGRPLRPPHAGRGGAGGAGEPVLQDRQAEGGPGRRGARAGRAPLPPAGGGSTGAVRGGVRGGGGRTVQGLDPVLPCIAPHRGTRAPGVDHRSHDGAVVPARPGCTIRVLSIAVRTLPDAARPTGRRHSPPCSGSSPFGIR